MLSQVLLFVLLKNVEIKTAPNLKLFAGARMDEVFYWEILVVNSYYAVCCDQYVTHAFLVSKNKQVDPTADCLNTYHFLLRASAYKSLTPIMRFPNAVSISDIRQ